MKVSRGHRRLLLVPVLLLVAALSPAAQQPAPAVPVEPIGAILAAFQTHSVVALSDAHGNEQNHAFRLALVRDPRFAAIVNDIVIELGNARYQDVMDRFVRGEDVPYMALRKSWQDTTVTTAGNNYAMVQELVEAVRAVNAPLPRERQLRVLLGDPPIDWDNVREDHRKWLEMRDSYPAAVIQLEVLAKQRRALVLYGQLHFQRKNLFSNYDMRSWQAQTVVSLLEGATPTKVFTIWQEDLEKLPVDVSSWRVPSLALIRGTALGAADFTLYNPSPPARFAVRDGKTVPIPREEWRSMRAEDQVDAVLYLGPASSMRNRPSHEIPPALCFEPGSVEMQLKRIALSGVPQFEADRLKAYCTAQGPK